MTISCNGEELILNKERAIYWPAKEMLIISDLHIGKSAHFRKHGIQVPANIGNDDLERLGKLIGFYDPKTLVITGDMFHHKINSDVTLFSEWRKKFGGLKISLIKGNHDLLKSQEYQSLNIDLIPRELISAPFRLIHEQPKSLEKDEYYTISGHIHPGVTIYGKARQRLNLPCFYFGEHHAVLPAFSAFTGLSRIQPEKNDRFYAITPSGIIAV
ncbi:ligase-associated DNA damage response endonuclease PdeM [Pedobacter caeni]|uniref:Putative phosphoesterase n=1 Tax=Pedobacter caeni TaxID=288992 RepID=A0A1M5J0R1_9SPHI|nr:ligase-associated DNA damage response endonuclease PdeM [Pedobacter caeni]SHG33810.1 putative phosphoesterase [Pedobacter caeni]